MSLAFCAFCFAQMHFVLFLFAISTDQLLNKNITWLLHLCDGPEFGTKYLVARNILALEVVFISE